jgi:hypothetical protein
MRGALPPRFLHVIMLWCLDLRRDGRRGALLRAVPYSRAVYSSTASLLNSCTVIRSSSARTAQQISDCWNTDIPGNLIVSQLYLATPACYGTRDLCDVFTRARRTNPVHTPSRFIIHFNIIFSSTPICPMWPLPFNLFLHMFAISNFRTACHARLIFLYVRTLIIFRQVYIMNRHYFYVLLMQCKFPHLPHELPYVYVFPSLLTYSL